MTKYVSTEATRNPERWHLYPDASEDDGDLVATGHAICGRHGDGESVIEMDNQHIKLNSVDRWLNPEDYWSNTIVENVCPDCQRLIAAGYLADAEFLDAVRNDDWPTIDEAREQSHAI